MKFLIVAACIALACAAPPKQQPQQVQQQSKRSDEVSVVSQYSEADVEGAYKYGFQLDDGTSFDQQGTPEAESLGVQGSYRYIDPNGNPVTSEYSISNGIISGKYSYTDANGEEAFVSYTTNDGKYVPSGNIIPEEITNLARNAQPYDENEFRTTKKH